MLTSKLAKSMQAIRHTSAAYCERPLGTMRLWMAELYCCNAKPPSWTLHLGVQILLSPDSKRSCRELKASTACRIAGSMCAAWRTTLVQKPPSKNPAIWMEVLCLKNSKLLDSSSVPRNAIAGAAATKAFELVEVSASCDCPGLRCDVPAVAYPSHCISYGQYF